ncbi:hypothetical protein CPB84DRAFT_1852907 [Gymnopilus junonius]|uniref:Uncharacterized protein n=1 Tax=Gymnopilus junonius TaxID=109634 RepID=A0A9P5NCI1_GYMJU|nr:hypothetical protein CPB84DRAFT_1852907 [Gymnopilus junonius]
MPHIQEEDLCNSQSTPNNIAVSVNLDFPSGSQSNLPTNLSQTLGMSLSLSSRKSLQVPDTVKDAEVLSLLPALSNNDERELAPMTRSPGQQLSWSCYSGNLPNIY